MQLVFKTEGLRASRESLANEVLKQFNLPRSPSLAYFDDADHAWLAKDWGLKFRGVSTPVIGSGTWPDYVTDTLFDQGGIAYDFMIYLPGKTCLAEDPLLVITLAHEVQHFLQWAHEQKLWKAGTILFRNLAGFDLPKRWAWDVPTERQAMIVSKKVSEQVLGIEQINKFVEAKIAEGIHKEEWLFFKALSSSLNYGLLDDTIAIVSSYKSQLLRVQKEMAEAGEELDLDFSKTEWWK